MIQRYRLTQKELDEAVVAYVRLRGKPMDEETEPRVSWMVSHDDRCGTQLITAECSFEPKLRGAER